MAKFVASPVEVYDGEEADRRIQQVNDSRFATAQGILAVDQMRWEQAQIYERETWLKYNLQATTDRNEIHADGFAAYEALPTDLGAYVELGCGPFTSSRYILQRRTAQTVTLLDPLIEDYVREHPHCAYRTGVLITPDGGNSHVVERIQSTIERWTPDHLFDTVVMTNVLSHCYDALAIFDVVRHMVKPGGYLVFHEDPRPFTPMDLYDVGHPLVVLQETIDEFLSEFKEVYRNGNYFIGQKPGGIAEPDAGRNRSEWPVENAIVEPTAAKAPRRKGRGR